MRHRYIYVGPVLEFDRLISSKWTDETVAESEKRAMVNLSHQFKVENNRQTNARITLPGKVKEMEAIM